MTGVQTCALPILLVLEAQLGLGSKDRLLPEHHAPPHVELIAFLDAHHVTGKQLHVTGDDRLTMVLSRENLHDEDQLRAALAERFGGRAQLLDDLAAVSVVGTGINAAFENVRRGSAALATVAAAPHGIATSSFRITWLVPRGRVEDAVRALHATFIEGPRQPLP